MGVKVLAAPELLSETIASERVARLPCASFVFLRVCHNITNPRRNPGRNLNLNEMKIDESSLFTLHWLVLFLSTQVPKQTRDPPNGAPAARQRCSRSGSSDHCAG